MAQESENPSGSPGWKSDISSVSFIIPAHNEQNYLPQTLAALKTSIAACGLELPTVDDRDIENEYLSRDQKGGQKLNPNLCEIIVVNDASTDETAELARQHGAQVVNVELRNIGAVRNAGAQRARFPWLVFIDADTLVPSQTLQKTLQALAQGAVGGGARVELSGESPIPFIKWLMVLMLVLVWQILGRWAAGCYMFCRRDSFLEFGGFNERFYAAEELFFSRNLKRRGKFLLIKHPVKTSARKLHSYSVWQLIKFIILPLLSLRTPLQSKKGLDILYKDKR